MGLLIALTIILTRAASIHLFFGGTEYMRIGFGAYPVIFSGLMLGWRQGMIVGALGDFIGYQLNPLGPYLPHFTAIAALTGLIPGILFKVCGYKPGLWRFGLIIAITQLIVSLLLTPYTLWLLFKIPFALTIPQRLVGFAVTVPVFTYFSHILFARIPSLRQFYARRN
jgi:ECF transporter S component (folate family)